MSIGSYNFNSTALGSGVVDPNTVDPKLLEAQLQMMIQQGQNQTSTTNIWGSGQPVNSLTGTGDYNSILNMINSINNVDELVAQDMALMSTGVLPGGTEPEVWVASNGVEMDALKAAETLRDKFKAIGRYEVDNWIGRSVGYDKVITKEKMLSKAEESDDPDLKAAVEWFEAHGEVFDYMESIKTDGEGDGRFSRGDLNDFIEELSSTKEEAPAEE